MISTSLHLDLSQLFERTNDGALTRSVRLSHYRRESSNWLARHKRILDVFDDGATVCCSARICCQAGQHTELTVSGGYWLDTCIRGGWLLSNQNSADPNYWIPGPPMARTTDDGAHIISEAAISVGQLHASPDRLVVGFDVSDPCFLDCVVWQFSHAGSDAFLNLRSADALHAVPHFLWGSHDRYTQAADVYLHMVHGHVYESRTSWPKYWRICSENDAHALYVMLSGMYASTGEHLYSLLKDQLLLAVLDRQDLDGGWRHGEWTDRMESHYRLHCSAMHLLVDALEEREDPTVRRALRHAAAFLAHQTDRLDSGVWFLHDELEHSVESMHESPFRWLPSRAYGKSESNMLVLNSHLDATIALDRYGEVTGDEQYRPTVVQANAATRAVLSRRPAEWLYRLLFSALRLTFLPTTQAARLPLRLRGVKRAAWKYLVPLLPHLKARYPRLVMPGGYIERELSLRIFAHEYLPINLMDLLRFRRRFPNEPVEAIIRAGLALVQECRMFDRWPEVKGKEYAVGFWAEALYHACLLFPDHSFRVWLVQAVARLEVLELGLPPSLLGANSEAIPHRDQVPAPIVADPRLRIVNLSRKGAAEVLVVNASAENVRLQFVHNAPVGLAWHLGEDPEATSEPPDDVPADGWLWGRAFPILAA